MAVSTQLIQELRERTGAGIKACSQALQECNGELEKAIDFLRKKGLADASKKAGRETTAGAVFSYVHAGGKIGVLLELNCETDFVASNQMFQELGRDLCMQVCASKPIYVKREDVPGDVLEREKAIYLEQVKDKPENAREKIIQGKLEKFYKDVTLVDQSFVKEESKTVHEVITERIAVLKENISVKKFARFQVGEKS